MFRSCLAAFLTYAALSVCTLGTLATSPAHAAGGDLLVAPTRVVLDGQRGTEVILNNVGDETATYRISLELRRMTADGRLDEVSQEEANALEQAALKMIRYAPRRVTLPPNQPQAIRIGIRPPADLPDGEYRAHMLFRAIPDARSVTEQSEAPTEGLAIALTPIYGVTIPIIVRKGRLEATASIANGRIERDNEGAALAFDLARLGEGSTFGEIRVTKPGADEPLLVARGIAVYPELDGRTVRFPIPEELASAMKGPVSIAYYEASNAGGGLITKMDTVLQ
ncbi:fimbrial biogenesis chaperone [Alterisphingorhabdus coralli]|uniref:Molecular chaperone n=1 Tax=Alterisphingorhabdus coralli TaxID=3071408 RepID=A0AA97F8W8_9SPHN|nr:molecular chaperone [Parasphingorhabdus sp. SCSIO 66989]WOE75442.1 molecular chaperone [Parasphingorhabdus sp. SCSIO 66989]